MPRGWGASGPGPLWWRAPVRLLRQGAWALLVLAAFTLAATAGAAEVLSASAWQRVAVERVLAAVPPGAPPRAAPVLRLTGVPAPGPELEQLRARVDDVPGLGSAELLGVSFGDELDTSALVRVEGGVEGPDGSAAARLVAVEDIPARVVAEGAGAPAGDGPARTVWLASDVADAVGVEPGGEVDVVQRTFSGPRLVGEERQTVVLGGVLAVAEDGTTPADVPGSTFWEERAGRLPPDPGRGRRAAVVVAEPEAAAAVAAAVGDTVLWSVDARLDPPAASPSQLFTASAAVQELQRALATRRPGPEERVPLVSVTGLPALATAAQDVALRTVREARSAALGGIGLGLALVLAVSALDVARRRQELALLVGLGHRPAAVAGLGVLEVLPVAVLGWLAALPLAWLGVLAVTSAQPQPDMLAAAAVQAAAVVAVGVTAHCLVTWVAAAAAARRGARQEQQDRRPLPWRAALVVATVAAVAGLLAAPVGDARGLDVLVPVLVAASAGAVGASLLRRLVGRRGRGGRGRGAPASARSLGGTVLRRRLATDDGRVLVVTALAAAVGLSVHVLVGGLLVERSVTDKAAVLAAATTVVSARFAVELDPAMPASATTVVSARLLVDRDVTAPGSITVVREAEAPEGATIVFRDSGSLPGDRRVDVAVVRPQQVRDVALWGAGGGPLEVGRDALDVLARADRDAAPTGPARVPFDTSIAAIREGLTGPPPLPDGRAPVLLVGDPAGLRSGDETSLSTTSGPVPLVVVGVVPAFPGIDPDLRTGMVAATASYLPRLPNGDARFASRSPVLDVESVELWSGEPLGELTGELVDRGVAPELLEDERRVRSASAVLVRPAFVAAALASPYLVALAGLLLVAAVLALCLAVDRAATRTRAGDLVLARAGLGAGGTRLLLVAEAAVLLGAGVLLGVLGWLATLPLLQRLLEPDPAVPPLVHTAAVPLVLPQAALPVAAAVVAALVAAVAVAWSGSRARGQEEVLRGLR